MQQTSTAKLMAFFQRFQIHVWAQRVNETKITSENTFNGNHFRTKCNHESSNKEKPYFGCFFRFVSHALTLRPQNMYM